MSLNKISIKIGGPAGSGVFTIGLLLSKYFQRAGLNVVYTTDYPSLIRGGHNTCCVRAENEEINAEVLNHDVLVALDDLTITEDLKQLNKGAVLICDTKSTFESADYQVLKVDFDKLLDGMDKRYFNTIAFGCVIGLMGEDGDMLRDALATHFRKKSQEVVEENLKAAQVGYDFAKEFCVQNNTGFLGRITKTQNSLGNTVFMSGNDAACVAAVKAGVKFVGEYPMTPSTSFLHYMAAHELDYNITTKQTEDEIAAINTAIGASVAGVRAMTATSGGGFALMNEAIGFAAIAEAPVVVFECMRGGPSTGIPTYTDQGDLKFVINSSQGEFPMVVLAPGDIEECFEESFNAFNLADILQTPVIVLLDKHLAASHFTAKRFDTSKLKVDRGKYINLSDEVLANNKRHEFTEDGISTRFNPGQPGGIYTSSSYEHDETGYTCEDSENHVKMMEKRFKKYDAIPKELLRPKMYGPEDADLTIVGWGSTKGVALDAIKYLNSDGLKVNYMHFVYINPFDNEEVKSMLDSCKDTIILEANYTGQLRDIIREKTGFYIEKTYFKYDARPFYFQEVYTKIKEVLKK
ncbi:MAG: 2-oxoacid:acceptor oxidoreductase subunit alpha [Candidatus Woesearchaeota archaeon]|jgi:2-oxoglutarate ferredoxin oxidoreductase subunit alpha|nr:2-oxoacid:acceptor oxidoreductase subunit alpha [Candidatus Woesearchaeota archaeon]